MIRISPLAAVLAAALSCPTPARAEAPAPASCPAGSVRVRGFQGTVESSRGPRQKIIDTVCMDRTEVTSGSYAACVEAGTCTPTGSAVEAPGAGKAEAAFLATGCNEGKADRVRHPANCVDHSQAVTFCRWKGGRLPSVDEAAWAARGRDEERPFPWGDAPPDAKHLNGCGPECTRAREKAGAASLKPLFAGSDGFVSTAPVGSFPAGGSRDGLLDLSGNVAEWTGTRAAGGAYAITGGGYASTDPAVVKAGAISILGQTSRRPDVGFRCVLDERTAQSPAQKEQQARAESAAQACKARALKEFVRRCHQRCAQLAKSAPNAWATDDCMARCNDQPEMYLFLQKCMEGSGYPDYPWYKIT